MFESASFKIPRSVIDNLREKHCDNCKVCKGRRIIEGATGPRKCVCVEQFNKEYNFILANIPKKFREFLYNNIDAEFAGNNKDGLAMVAIYIEKLSDMLKAGKGLFMQGGNGAGKSFIAVRVLKKALEQGYSGYFILQRDLINTAFAALYDEDIKADLETLICKIDFLIIDEIDKMFVDSAEKVKTLLEGLLKKRSYSGKPLLVTSNIGIDRLTATLGQTIAAIFEEDLVDVTFTGNYRLKLSQQNKDLLSDANE